MTKAAIREWRKRFRDYVRFRDYETTDWIDLSDTEGNDISFDCGRPMWNQKLTVYDAGNFVNVTVRKDGCVCENDERKVGKWIRRFAALNGVYHVSVDVDIVRDNGGSYSIEVSTSFIGKDIYPKPKPQEDSDSYWVIGDLDRYDFYGSKADGFDHSTMTVNDPAVADQFESFEEAVEAMAEDDDVFEWVDEQQDPESVRPLFVEIITKVKAAKR